MSNKNKFYDYISNSKANLNFTVSSLVDSQTEYKEDMSIEVYLEINSDTCLQFASKFNETLLNFNRSELTHIGSEGYSWVNYYEDSNYLYKVNETDPMSGAPNLITKFKKLKS